MQLVFCFYKYFPFGGLQRDFMRIALACQKRGHAIRVYTLEWTGDVPADAVTGTGTTFPGLHISVRNAPGTKCPRCWMHSLDADEHDLCPRCAAVCKALDVVFD